MSVIDCKTFISKIRTKLKEEIRDQQIVKNWFNRIIIIEFLQTRNIIPVISNYNKDEVLKACYFIDNYFVGLFNDNTQQLFDTFPNNFYSKEIIQLLKENITKDTPIEEISNYQEDFKDHERYDEFKIVNRNLETEVNSKNITALTQIFTPKWICKYLVDETINSQSEKFQDIKILDPCLGTGQILIYTFDKLVKLYQENTKYSILEIIERIFKNQLYGFDIDEQAIILAKFIFMMKAYELTNDFIHTNIGLNFYLIKDYEDKKYNKEFIKASLYGSLINVDKLDYNKLINESSSEEEKDYLIVCKHLNEKYDVVITNPPYMGRKILPDELLKYLNDNFKYGKSELYTSFIERCLSFLKDNGYLGMITLHTWMFIKSFTNLRKYILENYQIKSLLHLGKNTFENLNAYNALAVSFIIQNKRPHNDTKFFDLTKYDTIALKEIAYNNQSDIYNINQSKLLILDNYQFLYWLKEDEYNHLLNTPKLANYCNIRQGLATGNNEKYIRYWWEVDKSSIGFNFNSYQEFLKSQYKYAPYNKGGDQTKWYSTSKVVIKFDKKHFDELRLKGNHLPSKEYYFKKGITWSLFGFNSFNVRYKEQGYVFDVSGSSLFTTDDKIKYILAFLSSNVAFYFLSSIAPTVNFQVGNIISLPFVYNENYLDEVNELVEQLIKQSIYLDSQDELSWNFNGYDLIKNYNYQKSLIDNINEYNNKINYIYNDISCKEGKLNDIFNKIYNLEIPSNINKIEQPISIKESVDKLISYLVGVVFGRYKLDDYQVVVNNSYFIDVDVVTFEIKKILSNDIVKQIEEVLKTSLNIYMIKYFGKKHINQYHNLPVYWYKNFKNKTFIGYYHTLKEISISKDEGIRLNYLKHNLIYKLK